MCLLMCSERMKYMYEFVSLVKRHMLKFLRDKTAVFFSFLSVIILLTLYFLFIGENYVSELRNLQEDGLISREFVDFMKISNMKMHWKYSYRWMTASRSYLPERLISIYKTI